jgi:DNA polymerase III alpha subunit
MGYASCRAHSTAYGVEAHEAAHLKRYYPTEFLSCVLTHGRGFYSRLVYSLKRGRLGIGFLLPDVNLSSMRIFPKADQSAFPVPDKWHRRRHPGTLARCCSAGKSPSCRMFRCRSLIAQNCQSGNRTARLCRFSGHPLDLYADVQWKTYCQLPISETIHTPGHRCRMIVEERLHHQMDGRILKFISICDYSGILECDFSQARIEFTAWRQFDTL